MKSHQWRPRWKHINRQPSTEELKWFNSRNKQQRQQEKKNDEIHTQREKEMTMKKKKNNKKLIIIIKCVYHVYLRCVSDYKITHAMSGLCILYSMNAKCNNEENRKFHHDKVALNSLWLFDSRSVSLCICIVFFSIVSVYNHLFLTELV